MLVWLVFIVFVILALMLDLGVFNRSPHVIGAKEAAVWTSIWALSAIMFSLVIFFAFRSGRVANPTGLTAYNAVVKYITGYLIELTLSIDNIFIIAVIFSSLAIPPKYQHEVLFYGVLGAIVFRALMIVFGVTLIKKFTWAIYVFGALLFFAAFKMLHHKNEDFNPQKSGIFRWITKIFPVTTEIDEGRFFTRKTGVTLATPLFVAIVIIELTDILFAVDSIPAILAITADPFIVFTSNILAVMGLRSLFFLISRILDKFRYINYSLAVILGYVGIKMILSHHVDFPEWLSPGIIVTAVGAAIMASILTSEEKK